MKCMCGCGIDVKRNFKYGHNLKLFKPTLEQTELRIQALKLAWSKKTPEQRKLYGRKISATKNTPEGKEKSRRAAQKCREKVRLKLVGRIPYNKLPIEKLINKICEYCNDSFKVLPCKATQRFCRRECANAYKKGRPHLNWNPNSFHSKAGYGVCGEYRGIRFRSTLELSFIYRACQLGHTVEAEPIRIKLVDYLQKSPYIEIAGIKANQYYSPDYLVNKEFFVEIKPEKFISTGKHRDNSRYPDPIIAAKLVALSNYCLQNSYKFFLITDEDMGEFVLTDKKIRQIPPYDIKFYKKTHHEKYKVDA